MNSTHASMSEEIEHAETGTHERLVQPRGSFFLTLSPVAAPIPVPQPTSPGLQRFRFFFTRRREDGRERLAHPFEAVGDGDEDVLAAA